MDERPRCNWVAHDELLSQYHDFEWGHLPQTDEEWLEKIVLETFQAGLSWRTVLHKRGAFREAMYSFHPDKLSSASTSTIENWMQNQSLIRNRKKLEAAVQNAIISKRLISAFGSLGQAMQSFGREEDPLLSHLQSTFKFVGRTTAESIAFATGLLPAPHQPHCHLHHARTDVG